MHLPLLTWSLPQPIPALPGSSAHSQEPTGCAGTLPDWQETLWGHVCKHQPLGSPLEKQPLGSPLVPHGLGSPEFGLWDCPCGFEGLGRGAAWLGSWRRTPRDLHFIAGSFCRVGRENPGAPGTELETPSSVPYIPQNPTISTLLLFKKVNKIPSFKERKKKKKGKENMQQTLLCVFFDLVISVANFPKRHKQTHAEPEYQ